MLFELALLLIRKKMDEKNKGFHGRNLLQYKDFQFSFYLATYFCLENMINHKMNNISFFQYMINFCVNFVLILTN